MSDPAFLSGSARWNAVKRRDMLADGVFIYDVRTTKIYCRPVCKARLARRANVVFYDTADEAERSNYRPCKRCKPDLAGRIPETNAVQRVRAMVEQGFPRVATGANAEGYLTSPDVGCLTQMAEQAGLSKWHFHRVFKEVTRMTPTEYLRHQNDNSSTCSTVIAEDLCSESQRFGVPEEITMTSEFGGFAVATTEAKLDASLALPLTSIIPGHPKLAIDPALEDLYFDLDNLSSRNADDNLPFHLNDFPINVNDLNFDFASFLANIDNHLMYV